MAVLLLSLIPPNALPLHLAPLRCQGRCSCTHMSARACRGERGSGEARLGLSLLGWRCGTGQMAEIRFTGR